MTTTLTQLWNEAYTHLNAATEIQTRIGTMLGFGSAGTISATNGKAGTGATRTRTRRATSATKTAATQQSAARQRGSTGRKRATAPPGELAEQIYGLIPGGTGISNADLAKQLGKRPQDLARMTALKNSDRLLYQNGAWFRRTQPETQQTEQQPEMREQAA